MFETLKGFPDWRLVDILVSDRASQAIALGTTPDQVVEHLAARIYEVGPGTTRLVDDGACQEVVRTGDEVDLRQLPIPIHSFGDGDGTNPRFLGSGMTITKDPDTGVRNEAVIRTQLRDDQPRRVAFRMAPRHNLTHLEKYEARAEPMPMAYAIGVHPAYEILCNYSGIHLGYDEFALGAGVLDEELEMVKCATVDLEVPAHAELVVEGLVPPGIREPEGPFGEFTGFAGGIEGPAPVMDVTAVTHREEPIFRHIQSTVFTDHQALVALPMEAAIYNRVKDVQGGIPIHGVHVPPWAGLFTTVISVTARWDGQAEAIGQAALSGVNLHPKIAIIVDDDVDIYNAQDILWAITQRTDAQHDVSILANQRIHPLDQSVSAAPDEPNALRVGGKLIIDATKPPLWREAERAEHDRVRPMGTGDGALATVLAAVREASRR